MLIQVQGVAVNLQLVQRYAWQKEATVIIQVQPFKIQDDAGPLCSPLSYNEVNRHHYVFHPRFRSFQFTPPSSRFTKLENIQISSSDPTWVIDQNL